MTAKNATSEGPLGLCSRTAASSERALGIDDDASINGRHYPRCLTW